MVTKALLLNETFADKLDKLTEAVRLSGGEKPKTWEDIQRVCRLGTAKTWLEIGDIYNFKRDEVDVPCVLVDFLDGNRKGSIKLKNDNLVQGAVFQTVDCLYSLQFDEREAFYCADNGLEAGDYCFTLGEHTWVSSDVGKTFYFHLSNAVPAGGQLVWKQSYDATLEGGGIDVFDSGNDFTANETATMSSTPISGATSLGTIKNSFFDDGFNSCQRACLGNNRWKESAMRQHLNSNGVAGSVWTPQNKWDRPPSWRASTKGFMNGLETDFTNFVAEVELDTYRNTVCDGGGLDTTEDKIFLPSKAELYMAKEGADNGVAWDFFKEAIGTGSPTDSAAVARSKHIVNASSNTYWWERVPYVGDANHVRFVYPDGSANYISAYYAYGVAPAFVIA